MEFFNKAKVVRLRSHLNKFLVADEDQHTVRQSRNGSCVKAWWAVEMVEGKSHVIRLKSCSSGKYLTASNEPFLTGMTGKKVVQDVSLANDLVGWEPIKKGELVKLRAKGGKYLRGNGGTPPWRNSVTYDLPHRTATQDWVLWGVDVIDIVFGSRESRTRDVERIKADCCVSPVSYDGSPCGDGRERGMEFFYGEKGVRLHGYHNNYLDSDDEEEDEAGI